MRADLPSAFRFRHILVREAAYGATAKKLRAVLHEGFAGWLERVAGERVIEYEEILGYHLEQSFRFRAELGPVDDDARALARRAAGRLATAGRRASARGDVEAAINLCQRAAALLPDGSSERLELLPGLGELLYEAGRLEEAEALLEDGIAAAEALGDERLRASARVERALLKLSADPRGWSDRALSDGEEAIGVFEACGDERGLARAWEVVHGFHWLRGELTAARAAARRGLAYAERAGDERQQGRLRMGVTAPAFFGSTPLDEVVEEMQRDLAWARRTGSLWFEAAGVQAIGMVKVAQGRREGEELIVRGMAIVSDLGMRLFAAGLVANWIWLVTDDPVDVEARLRESYDVLAEAGDQGILSFVAVNLAEALYRQGRYDEADEMTRVSAEAAAATTWARR